MSKVVAILAAGVLVAAPAHADPGGEGLLCGATWLTEPSPGGTVWSGEIDGGPLVAGDPESTISMRCSVQVGRANDRHSGQDAVSVESAASTGWTAIPPTTASYAVPPGEEAYLCTEATVDGTAYYWDSAEGTWSTKGDVACLLSPELVRHVVDTLNSGCEADLCVPPDMTCPILATVSGTDGDVPGVVECPPYES